MASAWPVTLPTRPIVDGYEETVPNTALRTEMDIGPAKVRRRLSAGVREFNVQMVMTKTQVETLDVFFVTTLEGGTQQFDLEHPRLETTATLRFVEPPIYQGFTDDDYRVSMKLEKLP